MPIRGAMVKRSNRLHSTYTSDRSDTHASSMTVIYYLHTCTFISIILVVILESSLHGTLTYPFIIATSCPPRHLKTLWPCTCPSSSPLLLRSKTGPMNSRSGSISMACMRGPTNSGNALFGTVEPPPQPTMPSGVTTLNSSVSNSR